MFNKLQNQNSNFQSAVTGLRSGCGLGPRMFTSTRATESPRRVLYTRKAVGSKQVVFRSWKGCGIALLQRWIGNVINFVEILVKFPPVADFCILAAISLMNATEVNIYKMPLQVPNRETRRIVSTGTFDKSSHWCLASKTELKTITHLKVHLWDNFKICFSLKYDGTPSKW